MAVQDHPRERSLGELFGDLGSQLRELVTNEIALARAELRQKAEQLSTSGRSFAIAGVLAHAGLLTLMAAVVLGVIAAFDMAAWLAALSVAVVTLAAAGAFFLIGRSVLRREPLMPRQTIDSVKENVQWLKSHSR